MDWRQWARIRPRSGSEPPSPASATPTTAPPRTPDLALLEAVVAEVSIPTIAEGRFQTAEQVRRAFDLGAFAVVVGGAITDPVAITRRFAAAVPERRTHDA